MWLTAILPNTSKAITLNPNHANVAAKAAAVMSYTGRSEDAVALVKRAMRLDPHHPDWYWQELALALYVGGHHTEAIRALNHKTNHEAWDYAYLAVCCVAMGEIEQAKCHVENLLQMKPGASVRYHEKSECYKNDADLERFLNALRTAGLPE